MRLLFLCLVYVSSVPPSEGPSHVEVPNTGGADVGRGHVAYSSGVGSSPAQSLSPSASITDLHQPTQHSQFKHLV